MSVPFDPAPRLRPRRRITGMSAILLPFTERSEVDWPGFEQHLERTLAAGLIPAVNMDTGFINLLDDATRLEVLARATRICEGRPFVAGAFVADAPGAAFAADQYNRACNEIRQAGGTPVIFQSFGLTAGTGEEIISRYRHIARGGSFYAFELGTMFAPFGAIYDLATYEQLLRIPECLGAKHSSLSRELEWQRLELRDRVRPDFKVLTGNDLAIDMVMYGSDYLLGLSTCAPDLFARRDRYWAAGDIRFYELNDWLQYLGFLAFRPPVPAYKHSAAQFLRLRGWLQSDNTHPRSLSRPVTDVPILKEIAAKVDESLRNSKSYQQG